MAWYNNYHFNKCHSKKDKNPSIQISKCNIVLPNVDLFEQGHDSGVWLKNQIGSPAWCRHDTQYYMWSIVYIATSIMMFTLQHVGRVALEGLKHHSGISGISEGSLGVFTTSDTLLLPHIAAGFDLLPHEWLWLWSASIWIKVDLDLYLEWKDGGALWILFILVEESVVMRFFLIRSSLISQMARKYSGVSGLMKSS